MSDKELLESIQKDLIIIKTALAVIIANQDSGQPINTSTQINKYLKIMESKNYSIDNLLQGHQ